MRSYVSPIGYNSTSVVRPVLSRGLDSGDAIYLVRPADESDDQRAEEAVGDVRRLVSEIEPDVDLTVKRLPHEDYAASVLACSDLFTSLDGDIVVNFGGGARDVLVPLTTAALVHRNQLATVISFSDVDGSVREVDLPSFSPVVPNATVPTFQAIVANDGSASIPELTKSSDRSKSSITRHVTRLEEYDLVETTTEGKVKHVELTVTGKLAHQTLHG